MLCLSFNGSWVGNEWHSMFTAVHVGLITHSLIIGKTKVSVKVSVSAIHLTGSIGIANTFFCEYRYRYRRYFYKVSLTTLVIVVSADLTAAVRPDNSIHLKVSSTLQPALLLKLKPSQFLMCCLH